MENRRDTWEGGSVRPPQDRGGCAGSCLTARLEATAKGLRYSYWCIGVFFCVRLCTRYMHLFIRVGPNETSQCE